ncbi:MAG: hypothetical protein OES32_15035 [Acidobacteriota bacterium]|nr:hypothetical protein [Acidobacteriota bacterium]
MVFRTSSTVGLALAVVLAALGQGALAAQTLAPAERIQAIETQAQWLNDIVGRMELNGKVLSDADSRTLSQINAQLAKFSRLATAGSGVAREDALAVQDQLAQLWVNVRRMQASQPALPEAAASPAPAVQYTLPSGTHALVQLTTWLSSANAQVGDRFSALLTEPIYAGGAIAIPAGAVFEGFVSQVEAAGRVSDAGKLFLYIDRLRGDSGQILDLRGLVVGTGSGDPIKGEGANLGRTAAVGAAGAIIGGLLKGKEGALIGATIGAGGTLLAEKGKNVDLPQGTVLRVEMQDPVSINWTWKQAQ